MGKKILFAVMALLVMATGKIWAEGETTEQKPKAYAVLYQNTEKAIGSLHFMYTNVIPTEKTVEIPNGGTSDDTTPIKFTKAWEVPTGEISDMVDNWIKNPDGITQVVFEESFNAVKVTNCSNWFDGLKNLTDITGIENLNTSSVTDMSDMFNGCSSLISLDLRSFDTSNVIYMNSMFQGCSGLTTLTLSSFDTSKVENMAKMFWECSSLTELDLSSFNTSKVTDMIWMFSDCGSLTSLDLRSFNTSKVTNMGSMFYGCSSLKSLDLSSFNTSSVTNMMSMFSGCKNLSNLTLGSFDMTLEKRVNNKNDMFYDSNITANGNALVFVTSEDQKNIWNGITGVNLMVKKDGEDKYVSDGTVDITLDNNEDTPVIFPQKFTANSVTFTRTFAAGKPHTVCLPFAITNTAAYGTFYELSGYDNGKVKFKKVDATVGNKPYLFIPKTADVTKIEVTGNVDISSTVSGGYAWGDRNTRFYGVYEKKIFTKAEEDEGIYYGWTAEGDFKRAGEGASVAPCRAYIKLKKETTDIGGGSSDNAPARLSVEFDDGETTGIDTIGTANGGADAPMYNLQGQRVSGGYKGVVIKNGKKMIVK